jgi:hypothetical protein
MSSIPDKNVAREEALPGLPEKVDFFFFLDIVFLWRETLF